MPQVRPAHKALRAMSGLQVLREQQARPVRLAQQVPLGLRGPRGRKEIRDPRAILARRVPPDLRVLQERLGLLVPVGLRVLRAKQAPQAPWERQDLPDQRERRALRAP